MLNKFGDSAAVIELLRAEVVAALVRQRDLESLIQERQLAKPACQRVLDDFQDDRGELLSTVLASKGMTHQAFLSSLIFVDAESTGPCQAHKTVAFTSPRERVIRVCASRFAELTLSNQKHMEIVIIHELLHALGLGENPPSSVQITAQVMRRCGP